MSAFQYENVIFPDNEPVLLVNRDWQIPGRKQRKPKQGQETQYHTGGGKVHTFRVRNQAPSASSKIQLEACSARSVKHTTAPSRQHEPTVAQSTFMGVFQQERPAAIRRRRQSQKEDETSPQRTSKSSSEEETTPEEGRVFEATLVENDDYTLIPSSRVNYHAARQTLPGVDACLLHLASYETPDFIPKSSFLNYYVINVADFLYPLKGLYKLNPLLSVWLPIILVDELWFYCILYTVARHLHANQRHRSYERECIYLADLLLQKLRRRLEANADGEGLTDVDCAAVACLLGVEHAFGTREGAAQHARGLASFVDKRGGVNSISGVLRTKICRADVECAIDYAYEPAIKYPADGKPAPASNNLPTHSEKADGRAAFAPLTSGLSEPLRTIAGDFLFVVAHMNDQLAQDELLDPFVLDDSVLCLQHRLAMCKFEWLSPIDRMFRAACHIFIKCLIRPLGTVSRTSIPLVAQIQEYIDDRSDVPRELYLWMLFMGLIGGQPLQQERIYISSRVVELLKGERRDLPSWNEIKEELMQVAWIPVILDSVGEKIWSELDAVALVS